MIVCTTNEKRDHSAKPTWIRHGLAWIHLSGGSALIHAKPCLIQPNPCRSDLIHSDPLWFTLVWVDQPLMRPHPRWLYSRITVVGRNLFHFFLKDTLNNSIVHTDHSAKVLILSILKRNTQNLWNNFCYELVFIQNSGLVQFYTFLSIEAVKILSIKTTVVSLCFIHLFSKRLGRPKATNVLFLK